MTLANACSPLVFPLQWEWGPSSRASIPFPVLTHLCAHTLRKSRDSLASSTSLPFLLLCLTTAFGKEDGEALSFVRIRHGMSLSCTSAGLKRSLPRRVSLSLSLIATLPSLLFSLVLLFTFLLSLSRPLPPLSLWVLPNPSFALCPTTTTSQRHQSFNARMHIPHLHVSGKEKTVETSGGGALFVVPPSPRLPFFLDLFCDGAVCCRCCRWCSLPSVSLACPLDGGGPPRNDLHTTL